MLRYFQVALLPLRELLLPIKHSNGLTSIFQVLKPVQYTWRRLINK
jgi:hypothetical protein